jgi:glycosyltransferase involved in cell wall biosynthesis
MKIIVAVHELIVEKSHLMPWRTVCDVVLHLRNAGHEVNLLSLGTEKKMLIGYGVPTGTMQIRKKPKQLSKDLNEVIENDQPDIIFWPVTWRENNQKLKVVSTFKIPIVAWFPGGVYSLKGVCYAIKTLGLIRCKPYFFELIANKTQKIKQFKTCNVKAILTMTTTTSLAVVNAGWPNDQCFTVPPGKDLPRKESDLPELDDDFLSWSKRQPYYLYMGPPSGIRGVFELLLAFDIAAQKDPDILLTCLFRSDAKLDMDEIKSLISTLKYKDRIYCTWVSLEKEQLLSFIKSSFAITMPFVLVPSEIPLAIIEAMAFGVPIITTTPGGTGDFVSKFGFAPKVGNVNQLAEVLYSLSNDSDMYNKAIENTKKAFISHPNWKEVSDKWYEIARISTRNEDENINVSK